MEERERRIGINEALFREVNERLRDVNEAFGSLTNRAELVCECGRADCTKRITMTVEEYEQVRAVPEQFAVAPGHEDPTDVEWVTDSRDGWDLVRKRPGAPTALAERTDRRS
jgi:hypothetical protein